MILYSNESPGNMFNYLYIYIDSKQSSLTIIIVVIEKTFALLIYLYIVSKNRYLKDIHVFILYIEPVFY